MKRPTTLLSRVLLNEGLQTNVAVERDVQEIERRFEHEGVSFLTIALPTLCDALDQALALGRITPSMFNGFKPFKRGGKLPALLSGFFMRVFRSDGTLKDCPCIDSIRAIRQVTRLFKKVELPCSSARMLRAFERYKSNDESISEEIAVSDYYSRISSMLWAGLERFAGDQFCSPGIFGTGASAERSRFNERHSIKRWHSRAEPWFPLDYHSGYDWSDVDSFKEIEIVPEDQEQPVRVVAVSKTLKTPRVISVEPSIMMLKQQSVAKPLMEWLESGNFPYRSIRFSDQSVNQEMARVGSQDGSFATIDLKDASDLVSNALVKQTFKSVPAFLDYIQACRSLRAQMPDKTVINLRKFASQGSALCFPIEAMIFFTIVIYSISRRSGVSPSSNWLKKTAANVFVYGDDIIIPAETAPGVMEDLETFGLKVNHDKSFTTGFFRESCGGDFYKGVDVTPAYCRRWAPGNTRDPRVIVAYVSLSNQFYMKGLWHASQYIRESSSLRRLRIPRSREPIGVLYYTSVCFSTGLRWDRALHGYRVKGYALGVGRRDDPVRDLRGAMLLAFSSKSLRGRLDAVKTASRSFSAGRSIRPTNLERTAVGTIDCTSFRSTVDYSHEPSLVDHISELGGTHVSPQADYGLQAWERALSLSGQSNGQRLFGHLDGLAEGLDPLTSVDSYVSKLKRRWAPTKVGLPGWLLPKKK